MELGATNAEKQAPCKGYLDLVSVAELQEVVGKVKAVESKSGLEELKKSLREMRKPVSTMVSTVSSLAKDMNRSIEKAKKDKEKEGGLQVLGATTLVLLSSALKTDMTSRHAAETLAAQVRAAAATGNRMRAVDKLPSALAPFLETIRKEVCPSLAAAKLPPPPELQQHLSVQTFATGPTAAGTPFCQACDAMSEQGSVGRLGLPCLCDSIYCSSRLLSSL